MLQSHAQVGNIDINTALPHKCKEFFKDDCEMEIPSPDIASVKAQVNTCCKKGGHQDALCGSIMTEVFEKHFHDDAVSESTCAVLKDLYKSHMDWVQDAKPANASLTQKTHAFAQEVDLERE